MDWSVAPRTVDELHKTILARAESLPKRLRQCAEFVGANRAKIAFRTVAELSQEAGVSPSAFMRFCQELGFSGFAEMQEIYRESYDEWWPDYSRRLAALSRNDSNSPARLLAEFADAGRRSIEDLVNSLDTRALEDVVGVLAKADRLHVVGFHRSYSVATYLTYALQKMDVPAMLLGTVGKLDAHHALRSGDAMIAIGFSPYAPETISYSELARSRNIPVVAITDFPTSPLARMANEVLAVSEADFGAFRSLCATITLSVVLAVSIGTARAV